MGNLLLTGILNVIAGKFKQLCARITHNNLAYASGKATELQGRVQLKAGQTKNMLNRWFRRGL